MAHAPQFLTLKDNRDDRGRVELIVRRSFLTVLTLVIVAGLFNMFGEDDIGATARAPAAELHVSAPDRLRGGLFYQGRFTIRARADIKSTTLVLDRGWAEQTSINTIEPAPVGEASRDGRLALDFGHVGAGHELVVWMQFQVNPLNFGRRSQAVALFDGEQELARIERTLTVFP